jgi:enediyne biosynthesis protein E4
LHNQTANQNHFLVLALEGSRSNRDGVGAQVAVTAAGKTRFAARYGGGSYLSSSDHRLFFGLGAATVADRVEVAWPSGQRDTYRNLAANSGYRLREQDSEPKPIAGFAPGLSPIDHLTN